MTAAAYDKETQVEDLDAIKAAEGILSAKVAGETPTDLKPKMHIYARIAGYHEPNNGQVKAVARMFWAITTHEKIAGFDMQRYAALLPEVRKLVKSKLIRRRKAGKPCLMPDVHRQKCYCGNAQRAATMNADREAFSSVGRGAEIIPS